MNTPNAFEERYTLPTYAKLPVALERGAGSFVWDDQGRRYLDFYGGHCVTAIGHCPPKVVEAVTAQLSELIFYSNAVYSPLRGRAAKRLIDLCPDHIVQAFFCNSGTEANETALKLARKVTGRRQIVAMEGGFHGRTLGSLAVTWNEKYRNPYRSSLAATTFVPFGEEAAIDRAFAEYDDIAAVILEPIQSMAGVIEAPAEYYRHLSAICDRHGAVLIFDEVQTGAGRTGTFSFSEQVGVRPDLITLAKSLGSGVPVGAVLVSNEIAETIAPGDQGTTFGGGMLAMAAVEATLQTLLDEDLMSRAGELFDRIADRVAPLVRDVRGRGGLVGLVCDQPTAPIRRALLDEGVITGGADDPHVIRLMPPINTPFEAVDEFADAFERAVAAVSEHV